MTALTKQAPTESLCQKTERRKRRHHASSTVPSSWKLTAEQQAFISLFASEDCKKQ